MGFFDQNENEYEVSSQNEELNKALEAGYGTDAAEYKDGRSLQREDLEATLVTVLDVNKKDLKLFNKLHKQNESSTVHQIERQTDVGSDEFLFIGEGEEPGEDDAKFERKIFESKYVSSEWKTSHQITLTNNVQNPINAQKVAATMRVLKATERAIFHGDSSVNPLQYDGIVKTIKDSANNMDAEERLRATVVDLKGLEIGESSSEFGVKADESLFDDIAERVYSKGGDLTEAYFPPVVAQQFRNLFNDKLRYNTGDSHLGLTELPDVPTAIGSTIKIKGDCGVDKMFKVKGPVAAAGNTTKRPFTPTSITALAAASDDSEFTSGFAGDYMYAVHAVNAYGISAAKTLDSAVTVAAGNKVTLTITPNADGPRATGFIITRSSAGKTELMEMVRVKRTAGETTVVVDLNKDLPGTASIALLTPYTEEMLPNTSFAQLMGLSNFDLPTNSALTHRGVVALYGNLEMRAPEHCALITNVGYKGGLY